MLLCRIFDHKPEDFTDSGYMICKRCGAHEYYDNDKYHLFYSLSGIKTYCISQFQWFIKKYIYRIDMFLHPNKLPF